MIFFRLRQGIVLICLGVNLGLRVPLPKEKGDRLVIAAEEPRYTAELYFCVTKLHL